MLPQISVIFFAMIIHVSSYVNLGFVPVPALVVLGEPYAG
jgi:hypothetical protein